MMIEEFEVDDERRTFILIRDELELELELDDERRNVMIMRE